MVKQEIVEELIELQRKIDRDRRQYELDAWMSLNLGIGQLKNPVFHQQPRRDDDRQAGNRAESYANECNRHYR